MCPPAEKNGRGVEFSQASGLKEIVSNQSQRRSATTVTLSSQGRARDKRCRRRGKGMYGLIPAGGKQTQVTEDLRAMQAADATMSIGFPVCLIVSASGSNWERRCGSQWEPRLPVQTPATRWTKIPRLRSPEVGLSVRSEAGQGVRRHGIRRFRLGYQTRLTPLRFPKSRSLTVLGTKTIVA